MIKNFSYANNINMRLSLDKIVHNLNNIFV